jgi:polyphosphate kinase
MPNDKKKNFDLDDPSLYIGRDISWLAFNRRVLGEATSESNPLLERIKFLAIAASNLDEFFMKRIGLLKRLKANGIDAPSHDGMSVRQQLNAASLTIAELQDIQVNAWETSIKPGLAEQDIKILEYTDLKKKQRARVDEWFRINVFPILTPLAVDPGHRFPFISNLSLNLGVLVSKPGETENLFARLKVPDAIPRLIPVSDEAPIGSLPDSDSIAYVPLFQIITNNLPMIFPGMEVIDVLPFRVTRSLEVQQGSEDAEDLLEHVETALRLRRFAEPIRIETIPDPSKQILDLLLEELELDPQDVYARPGPLEYEDLMELYKLDRPSLKDKAWIGVVPPRLADDELDIFAAIRERDILLHHPYEAFDVSVERFIETAANDPNVLAIKQTLYRTSRDSPFIESLIHAAEEGKQVACLVELRARMDEDKNVRFARQLEGHGVHVAYGVVGLKTHSKCSLVVRKEPDGLRSYAHLGTGNYHPDTAQLYTDFGLLTCNTEITDDVVNVFNYLTGRSLNTEYNRLLVAPFTMRDRFYELIDQEIKNAKAGKPARIIGKMNQLEDIGIIKRLYKASQAGVDISMIVRGFCCLRPSIKGLSENIKVHANIGRFLEHSRFFHFANGQEDPIDGEWLIGSADWMSRNLNNRVEVITPVYDEYARRRLLEVIEINLADRKNAYKLRSDGHYVRLEPDPSDAEDSVSRIGTFDALCMKAEKSTRISTHDDE